MPEPSRRKLTYAEYAHYPADGRRHEIVDGDHFVNPSPSTYHQTLSRRIQFQLYQAIELRGLGEVFNAPMDVELSEHDIVQPDLIVLSLDEVGRLVTPSRIRGVPSLLVEILSPASVAYDRVTKRAAYERVGLPQYWVVDPERHVVEDYRLEDARYLLAGEEAEAVSVRAFEGVSVDLTAVW